MVKRALVSTGKLEAAREDVRAWDKAVNLFMRLRQLGASDPYWDKQLKKAKNIREKSLERLHNLDMASDKAET